MKRIRAHPHLWSLGSVLLLDLLFFGLTDPKNVPPLLLMAGFLLFVSTLYHLIKLTLTALGWYGLPSAINRRRLTVSATLVTAAFVALQSLGALGPRDVFILLPLSWLAYLYLSYGRSLKPAEASR